MKTIFIEDIADAFEAAMQDWAQFLNTETGEVVSLPDDDLYGNWTEDDEKLAEKIDSTDAYVRLPNQHELREYDIMENFADHVQNQRKADMLFRALNGRKSFRHFKDTIITLGLDEAYYAFRFLSFCKVAARWCQDNEIPYVYRDKKNGFLAGAILEHGSIED